MSSDARISPAIRFQIEQFVESVSLAAKLDLDERLSVSIELRGHLEDRFKEAIDSHGMNLSDAEALRRTLELFGSVESVAKNYRKPLLFRLLFQHRFRMERLLVIVIQPFLAYLIFSADWLGNWAQHAPRLKGDFSLITPTNTVELTDQAANMVLSRAVLAEHTARLLDYGFQFLMWLAFLSAIAFCNSESGREQLGRLSKIKWLFSLYLFWIWSKVFLYSLSACVFSSSDQPLLGILSKVSAVFLILISFLSLLSILIELGLRENLLKNFWRLKWKLRRA